MASALCYSHDAEDKQPPTALEPERSPPFKRFDIVTDFSDHHYAHSNLFPNCIGSDVSKKIMREWKILERNLPESIFVRAYEERIDLLRAVIVGPAGTPYHDGLFFFDLAFSSDYPICPPIVYYHSYGLRLNPNLYEDGYVCLSLINTWDGKKEERWNPAISTVLQILISIQALVLNERPYFNEPELDEAAEAEIYSDAYNKEAYLFCCKMTMRLIQNPPKNFEEFVRDYFRQRGKGILAACKAYSEGRVRVGRFSGSETENCSWSSSSSNGGNGTHVSAIFKALMEKTHRDLQAAFDLSSQE
ncbi:probable ubiquitin-conjugating enzyme E2 25 [Cucurbita moschata]|uniref:Probable ubiquitin-conjugating enzyme E2 25 n=1 Tax=Cucurbita moschata TaxID=3662 RepID=A0A6J1EWP5_CUCMO|nr:probable ubiquitin-conjugating enzyme E2 25 [Cucurbita moschata]